jgi:L-amino acid N-acyltransferase YncA
LDLDFFYEIRNHPLNRVFATIPDTNIDYKDHCQWFTQKIADPSNLFFVIRTNGSSAGYIRVNSANEISVALHPDWQKKGLGSGSLRELCRELATRPLFKGKELKAIILQTNKVSLNAFLKADFQIQSENLDVINLRKKL